MKGSGVNRMAVPPCVISVFEKTLIGFLGMCITFQEKLDSLNFVLAYLLRVPVLLLTVFLGIPYMFLAVIWDELRGNTFGQRN